MSSSYVDVATFRAAIDKTSTLDDPAIQFIIDAASEVIDAVCQRPDGFVADTIASARIYPGSGSEWQRIDECVEVTQVRLKTSATDTYATLAAADYLKATGDRRRPEYNVTPYTALRMDENGDYSTWYYAGGYPNVEVTAKWGNAVTVPAMVREATIVLAARAYKRGQSAWSDVLASGELGMLLYRAAMDPEVKLILIEGRLIRPSVGRR
ncbi:MAG: hypothetical protein ABFD92_21135 [Planctomycetaceae bacterium]